jgi:hypothetical protein
MIDPVEADRMHQSLDASLQSWRQGDFAIGPFGFVKRFDPGFPLKKEEPGQDYDSDLYEEKVAGYAVLTQTCDLVRSSKERPYFEASPLVAIADPNHLEDIRKGRRPRYARIPGAEDRALAADLDRVMTAEKTLLARWTRQTGCRNDEERRVFAEALARKRARFAFPDDFEEVAAGLKDRFIRKHDRESPEGEQLHALREIRVAAYPSWDVPAVTLKFWFIVDEEGIVTAELHHGCEAWLSWLAPNKRFSSIDYDLISLDGLSAREYTESDRLDLDHLSRGE